MAAGGGGGFKRCGGRGYRSAKYIPLKCILPKQNICIYNHALNGCVDQVACGSRDAQTLALSDEGMVFSWGDGDFGKESLTDVYRQERRVLL